MATSAYVEALTGPLPADQRAVSKRVWDYVLTSLTFGPVEALKRAGNFQAYWLSGTTAAVRFLLNDTIALTGGVGFGAGNAALSLSAPLNAAKLITSTSDYVTVQYIALAGSTFVSTACSFWAHKVTD